MKLILTQEVDRLGAAGDIVTVKPGYGRNFLVPNGMAIRWSRGAERTIEAMRKARDARKVRDADHAAELKQALEAATVQVQVRAGETGRLFGAVTPAEIATAIEATGTQIDKRTIMLAQPIKSLGTHEISVKLHEDVVATVNLNVVPA